MQIESIYDLTTLEDDWDGEGAPKPSSEAIEKAEAALKAINECSLLRCVTVEIDADVRGGVAIYLSRDGLYAWVAISNAKPPMLLCWAMARIPRSKLPRGRAWASTGELSQILGVFFTTGTQPA